MMTLTNLVSSFAMGTTVLLGQQIGCGERKQGGRTVGTAIVMFTVIALVMTAVLVIFAPQVSSIMNAPEEAFDKTVAYVKERKQFGRTIGQFQNTQFQLADMATKVKAAQMMVYRAAMAKATQKSYGVEAAMAKLYAAEVAMEVTTKAVQLHGGYGYTREYDVERMMRDAKITEIYEGTSEVQRMVISADLLK